MLTSFRFNLAIFVFCMMFVFGCSGQSGDDNPANSPHQKTWQTTSMLNADDSYAFNPEVAIDADANAVAVWYQADSPFDNIWTNRFDGTNWGTPEMIESDDSGDANQVQIATGDHGIALAVWHQSDGSRYSIWANRFDGTSWGTAVLIETNDSGDAEDPQIAVDCNGNAVAVWSQSNGSRYSIWSNRFDGTSWGTAVLIETNDSGDAQNPQIAVDCNGNAVAVWSQSNGSRYSIWANRFDGTNWASSVLIGTDDSFDESFPQIAAEDNGNTLVVWQQGEFPYQTIWANQFDGTNWTTALLIGSSTSIAFSPQIAIGGNSNAFAVWYQEDTSYYNIWANRFDGTNWGTAALIETNNFTDAKHPQIAVDSSGNAIAVWHQWNGSRASIWTNRFDGTSWGNPESIAANQPLGGALPQIAVGNDGNAFAIWSEWDSGGYSNIWAARFD